MKCYGIAWFVCLFEMFCRNREFFTHKKTSLLLLNGCKFCYAKACDNYYYTAYVYNRPLRGPATFPLVVKCLAVELSLPDCKTQVCSAGIQTFNLLNARHTLKSIAPPHVKKLLKYITTLAYSVTHSLDQQMFSTR